MADLRDTIHIDAPADLVYAMVSDLTRMGEWSPECDRVTWRGGATGPVKGAKFMGHNRVGTLQWFTLGTITAAEPGHLAFEIAIGPMRISRWEYFIAPDPEGTGCTVAEQWTDMRAKATRLMSDRVIGDRVARNRRGIRLTLAALKRSAERTSGH
ncbi:MAG: SRPBCC family protein [Dermatophilaceae bacterium]